jgi:hypothetical protein
VNKKVRVNGVMYAVSKELFVGGTPPKHVPRPDSTIFLVRVTETPEDWRSALR